MTNSLLAHCMLLLFAMTCSAASAENWPNWRGPRGDGTSVEKNVPTNWNGKSSENIAWKVAIPGAGHSSPIVWEDRIFVATCQTDQNPPARQLLCLDRRTGETIWKKDVVVAPLETKHGLNSYASGTPATDGKLVYVTFLRVGGKTIEARNVSRARPVTPGEIVVAAYDFAGNQKWIARPGGFVSVHGFCSSPVLFEDLIIINGDHDGDSYIAALKNTTGETVWKIPRKHKTRSYVTPIIREIEGRTQMILAGSKCVASYDPRTGEQHWIIDGPTEQFVASMVYNGRLLFLTCGFPERHYLAIDPTGEGNVTETHIRWRTTKAAGYVPSPVAIGDYFLNVSDKGIATCFDADTGKSHWVERLGPHFSASAVSAGGLAYFLADEGKMTIIRPGEKLDVVAVNELGEHCFASPAISNGQIFIRGEKHLYSIGPNHAD